MKYDPSPYNRISLLGFKYVLFLKKMRLPVSKINEYYSYLYRHQIWSQQDFLVNSHLVNCIKVRKICECVQYPSNIGKQILYAVLTSLLINKIICENMHFDNNKYLRAHYLHRY